MHVAAVLIIRVGNHASCEEAFVIESFSRIVLSGWNAAFMIHVRRGTGIGLWNYGCMGTLTNFVGPDDDKSALRRTHDSLLM